ncbi:hypothetical protein [Myxococcus sp. Y35]|uniref:hypothetical protein n=1 Tax=Pseudomyxococcus flavus TaxID=3115648 RepID=UPI003CEDC410
MHKRLLVFISILATSGCTVARPATLTVPKERAAECRTICTDLDMKLGAVVVIMNSAGCVCEPHDAVETAGPHGGSSSIAGGATIQAFLEHQQRTQASQQQK